VPARGGARRSGRTAVRRDATGGGEHAAGRLDLACQLVELAALADPEDSRIHTLRAAVYLERRRQETSLMAKGVYGAAARESQAKSGGESAGGSA